jgi:phosphate transport system substrate-binding protein
MLRSFARRGGIVLAALALPMLLIGNAATATTPAAAKLASATLNGSGSTFQYGYDQVVIGGFKQQQKAVTINYQPVGSGTGRTDFANGTTDFGGTDAPYKSTDPKPSGAFFYFPTVVAPITVSFNVEGVKVLKLSADTIAKIFEGNITTWDDTAIKADNPKAKLPGTTITVVHRSDSSGTTANFTNFLTKAAPTTWTLGTGSTVSWGSSTQGATGNSGVAKLVQTTDGAIGYVDFSDAKASDLTFAAVKNSAGKFVPPNLVSAAAAAAGATVNADLTYDPINAAGAGAYPITSPTWIMVLADQSDAARGNAIKGFLNYIYGDGQKLASSLDYAPLPKKLLAMSKAQVKKVVVPES